MTEQLARELKALFDEKKYKWRFDGEKKAVSYNDMQEFLNKVSDWFQEKEDGTWLESGRLIFIKQGDSLDVYALQGTIDAKSE